MKIIINTYLFRRWFLFSTNYNNVVLDLFFYGLHQRRLEPITLFGLLLFFSLYIRSH